MSNVQNFSWAEDQRFDREYDAFEDARGEYLASLDEPETDVDEQDDLYARGLYDEETC